jgi:hypothetical protein
MPDLNPKLPHPLAPTGSPTIAEEQAEHARQLAEHDDVRDLERRHARTHASLDTIFELVSGQVLPAITRTEIAISDAKAEQATLVTAVNRLADRVDGMGKAIHELDKRVSGLEVLDGRVTALEKEVASLKVQPKRARASKPPKKRAVKARGKTR